MSWNIGVAQNSGWDIGASQKTPVSTSTIIPLVYHLQRMLTGMIFQYSFSLLLSLVVIKIRRLR